MSVCVVVLFYAGGLLVLVPFQGRWDEKVMTMDVPKEELERGYVQRVA